MPAARLAGALALLAAVVVLVAAFLPQVTVPDSDFTFRTVDLDAPPSDWIPGLVFALIHTALLAVPGLSLLRASSPLALGVLLGIATYGVAGSLLTLVTPDEHFDPGIAVWMNLSAGLLVLMGTGFAIIKGPGEPPAPPEEAPPPQADWTTA